MVLSSDENLCHLIVTTELLYGDALKQEYEKLRPRYEIIAQIISARKEQNITQEQLAAKVGTQKFNISRLESGSYDPSLDMLIKVAHGLGKKLVIKL